jgi:MFS family permease
MTHELAEEFALSAAELGSLSALYFYSYVAMQIPTGILVDRWGPRKLLALGALIAAGGSFLFAEAPDMFWAGVGRLLIGASAGVAFVGMIKIASVWMAPRLFGLATGLGLFVGMIGAVAAGVPFRLLIDEFGWRQVMDVSALWALIAAVLIFLLMRDLPQEKGYQSYEDSQEASRTEGVVSSLRQVIRNRNVKLIIFVPGAMAGSILTFAGLWGVPFLSTHYHLNPTEAAAYTSLLVISSAIGGPIFGAASDRLSRRKPFLIGGVITASLGWSVIIFGAGMNLAFLLIALLLTGFSSGSMIICFAYAKESVPAKYAGSVAGLVNTGLMAGPMLLQPGVGWMLAISGGTLHAGQSGFDLVAYQKGFGLMLLWLAVALVLLFATRETRGTPLTRSSALERCLADSLS